MHRISRSHRPLLSCFVTAGVTALLGLLLTGATPSVGEKRIRSQDAKFDHWPIVTLAGDLKTDVGGKVIAIDPDTPDRVTRLATDSIGPVYAVTWTDDHAYLLLSAAKGFFMCRYDSGRHAFGPPIAVPNPGADPSIRWPAGYRKLEESIEDALRLKVRTTLSPNLGDALAWSPDRSRIAFTVDSKEMADEGAGEPYADLWVAQVNGLHITRLGHGSHPHWSPDGRSLVAIDGSALFGRRIARYDTATGKKTILRSGHLECFATALYSPSGTSIAVFGASDPTHEFDEGVFLMDNNGHLLRKLAPQKSIGVVSYPLELAW